MRKKILSLLLIGVLAVSVTGCASWNRFKKNVNSNVSDGLERTVRVYSATGELIETYEGKFDVDYKDGRVLFDDENGERHVIYFENGTVLVD